MKVIRTSKLDTYHIWIDGRLVKGLFYVNKRAAQKSALRLRKTYGYEAVVRRDKNEG